MKKVNWDNIEEKGIKKTNRFNLILKNQTICPKTVKGVRLVWLLLFFYLFISILFLHSHTEIETWLWWLIVSHILGCYAQTIRNILH